MEPEGQRRDVESLSAYLPKRSFLCDVEKRELIIFAGFGRSGRISIEQEYFHHRNNPERSISLWASN